MEVDRIKASRTMAPDTLMNNEQRTAPIKFLCDGYPNRGMDSDGKKAYTEERGEREKERERGEKETAHSRPSRREGSG